MMKQPRMVATRCVSAGTLPGLMAMSGWSMMLLCMLLTGPAEAGWKVLVHNSESLSDTSAKCLVAPKNGLNRLLIQRIRITRGGTTAVDHRFFAKVTEDVAGLNYNLSGCASPGCREILAVPGAKAGEVYDMDGLDIMLPPGGRLYYYPSATPGSSSTIEIFYQETQ